MNNNSKMLSPEDEYIAFVAYLRNNGVWKVVSNVFGMLNETRPEDPIEFFRQKVKPDNDDYRAVEQTRQAIAVAGRKIMVLKRDRDALTAKSDSLDKRIREGMERNRIMARRSAADGTSDDEVAGAEESLFDSDHV